MIVEIINYNECIFIINKGMKQCPRCKSVLAKSHGEKMVCRVCGFITRNLQVARDNQQFQQRLHYGKKISFARDIQPKNSIESHKQIKDHYIVSFQKMLRKAAINLIKQQNQLKKIQAHVRYIWMAYVNMASRHNLDIAGIFHKIMKNTQKNNKSQTKEQQIQEQQQKKEEDEGNMVEQEKQNIQDEHNNIIADNNNRKIVKKRGSRKKDITEGLSTHQQKKIPFKLQVQRKMNQINRDEIMCEEEKRVNLLQFLYASQQKQISDQLLDFIANKYSGLVITTLRAHNLNIGLSQAKGRPTKINIKQLQKLIQMRGHKFTEKSQMTIVLLIEDLLRKWSQQMQLQDDNSLQSLLLLYKSPRNTLTKPIISELLIRLMKLVDNQNQQNNNQKIAMPQLSLNLAYAIIYISSLLHCCTFTIDDIVCLCGPLTIYYQQQIKIIDQKVSNHKIRSIANALLKILNIPHQLTKLSLIKWVHKYSNICGISEYDNQLTVLTDILYQSMKIINKQRTLPQQTLLSQKRSQFLQQDIIAKSIITIYIKLQIGFQKQPFLASFPQQLIDKLKQIKLTKKNVKNIDKYIKLLQEISILRQKSMSINKIINKILQYYNESQRVTKLKFNYYTHNYSMLQNMNMKNLIKIVKRNYSSYYNFKPNFVITNQSQTEIKQVRLIADNIQYKNEYNISQNFIKQMQLAIQDKQSGNFKYEQLDAQCSNYQFLYQYMTNIEYLDLDLFRCFVGNLCGGECKSKQVYKWLQKLQKVMLDFQN